MGYRFSLTLRAVKVAHTLVWSFFAVCIVTIPMFALQGRISVAVGLIAVVFVEVAVLAMNGLRCPLTDVAARFTDDRRDNFDIYLPVWLARHNKTIFGAAYVAGCLFTLLRWLET